MSEREQATKIANMWLDFNMNSLTQMVHGDPDCDACVLARQYIRAMDEIDYLRSLAGAVTPGPSARQIFNDRLQKMQAETLKAHEEAVKFRQNPPHRYKLD